MQARAVALAFLRPYVERGSTLAYIKRNVLGGADGGNRVRVGGIVLNGDRPERLSRKQIAVLELGGVACLHIFELLELYRELNEGVQPSIFEFLPASCGVPEATLPEYR